MHELLMSVSKLTNERHTHTHKDKLEAEKKKQRDRLIYV